MTSNVGAQSRCDRSYHRRYMLCVFAGESPKGATCELANTINMWEDDRHQCAGIINPPIRASNLYSCHACREVGAILHETYLFFCIHMRKSGYESSWLERLVRVLSSSSLSNVFTLTAAANRFGFVSQPGTPTKAHCPERGKEWIRSFPPAAQTGRTFQ
jgi:hypothetical protein